MTLTYAELFAGAGGLSRGLEAAGFHCVAHAEIEPHARAVLRYRWPGTRLDGDVTQINGADYAGITLLSGGSPCQDLSVAGKRAGLAGGRSGLFHEQCRIWQESGAPYLLWENVLGALSSNRGKDFATVLSTLVGAPIPVPTDGWASGGVAAGRDAVAAWRVLDLQHFGPPQRRVRVFVLAARTGGVDPAEVLALAEGVCGHPSPRQQAREGTAGRAAGGVGAGRVIPYTASRFAQYEEGVGQLRAAGGDLGGGSETILAFHHTQTPISGEMVPAIGRTTNGMGVVAYSIGSHAGAADADVSNKSHASGGPTSMGIGKELANTIRAGRTQAVAVCTTGDITHALTHEGADASEDGTGRGTPIVVGNNGMESWHERDTAITLCARDAKGANNDVVGTLDFGGHGGSYNGQDAYQGRIRAEAGRPRRLTPRECEALMSWPTNWTQYGRKDDGTVYELSDTARYRLCGNGVGSVCVEWIATRLADAIAAQEPMRAAA